MNRIMSNAYLGMTAQSHALGTISNNVANARTVGYKTTDTQFQDLVAGDRFSRRFDGAGVQTYDRLRADAPGALNQTGQTTNGAIVGNGFFLVQEIDGATGDPTLTSAQLTKAGRNPELTRAGDFEPDQYGHLVNSTGRALMGFRLEDGGLQYAGGRNVKDLELVSLADMDAYVEGSTEIDIAANLPTEKLGADEPSPETGMSTTVSVVDSNGRLAAVDLNFVRTAANPDGSSTWEVRETGAVYEDGSAVPRDAPSGLLGTVSFRPGGALDGATEGEDVTFALNLGENFGAVDLNVGQVGTVNGLRSIPRMTYTGFSHGHDGVVAGSFRGVELTPDGVVRATYAGGETRDFYRIPNALVANTADLQSVSGTAFRTNQTSGDIILRDFGKAPPGSKDGEDANVQAEPGEEPMTVGAAIVASAVEDSNTELESQFSNLILTQRAYSANSKIMTTADEMTQTAAGLIG